jgi:hypothetical protein
MTDNLDGRRADQKSVWAMELPLKKLLKITGVVLGCVALAIGYLAYRPAHSYCELCGREVALAPYQQHSQLYAIVIGMQPTSHMVCPVVPQNNIEPEKTKDASSSDK